MTPHSLFDFNRQFEQSIELILRTPWTDLRLKQLNQLYSLLENSIAGEQRLPFRMELDSLAKNLLAEIFEESIGEIAYDPEDLISLHAHMKDSEAEKELQRLEYLLLEQLFKLGAHDKCTHVLSISSWFPWKDADGPPANVTDIKNFQREFLLRFGSRLPEELFIKLQKHLSPQKHNSSHNQVRGLFVSEAGNLKGGILADIALENLRTFRKAGTDQLRIATHLVDENDVLANQGHDLFRWLKQKYPERTRGHFRLEYTLSEKSSILSGASLGLAMALLAHMGLYALNSNRAFEPRVYDNVAVTGALDEAGNVLAVNAATLKYKIEAALFSNVQTIVLPVRNKSDAQIIQDELTSKYPLRQLKVVFMSHIDELENHREIFFFQRRKVSRRLGQFFKEYTHFVTVLIMILVLSLGAWFWFGILKDPIPVTLEHKNGEMVVLNKYGLMLWQGGPGSSHGKIIDILHSEIPEVILGYDRYTASALSGHVVCYDNTGKMLWKFKTGGVVRYGERVIENQFNGNVALVKDLNQDGSMEIVTTGTPANFPMQICVLDNHGVKLSEYWHAGQLQDPRDIEIFPENGTRELVFCGINNEYRSGMVLVLDPFRMKGCYSALDSNYLKIDTAPGNEIYYIKFPHTHFFVHPGYDRSDIVSSDPSGGMRIVNKNSVTLPNNSVSETPVFYVFDSALRLISASPGDKYYLTYKKYFTNREPLQYGDEDLIQYFAGIDYWSGESWESTSVVNQIYLNELSQ